MQMFLSIVFIFTVVNIQKLESGIFAFVDTQEIQVIFIKKKKRNIYLYRYTYANRFHIAYMYSVLFKMSDHCPRGELNFDPK